jgi:hypothetical protein
MILPFLGILSTAQDLTSGSTDSENVIQLPATDYIGITDVWWVVDCETVATGDGSDTFDFILYLSQEATLDTNIEVCSVGFTGYADIRIATAGRHIAALNVGKMLKDMLDTSGSDYPFIGMISTISAGSTVSINAALSNSEPQTEYHSQVNVSNVGTPS